MPLPSVYTLVLAGGDGTRLAPLTTRADGVVVPKQYCRFFGGRSLLEHTLTRAERLTTPDRVVTVVNSPHGAWWSRQLAGRHPDTIVVQEANRGTAAGLLLPIAHIVRQEDDPIVVVLPSDHFVADEAILERAIRDAIGVARRRPDQVVLLGMTPDWPETGYGWIVPNGHSDGVSRSVAGFVEKPERALATQLLDEGGLWSAFIMVAHARALTGLFAQHAPDVMREICRSVECHCHRPDAYSNAHIPVCDASREVFQRAPERLRVITVPPCGWTDLGTPDRMLRCLLDLADADDTSVRIAGAFTSLHA